MTLHARTRLLFSLLAALGASHTWAGATTFAVSNSGASSYLIDGVGNAPLTLTRGLTYTFNLNVSGHPFFIKTIQGSGTGNAFTNGVTGNGTTVGTLTFAVPGNAPDTLFYNCQFHGSMTGTITIVNGDPIFASGFE